MMNKWVRIVATWMVFSLPTLAHADITRLTQVQLKTMNNNARVSMHLNQSAPFHIFTLDNPARIVVDFQNVRLSTQMKNLNLKNSGVKNIRVGYPKPGILRLVLDINLATGFNVILQKQKNDVVFEFPVAIVGAPAQSAAVVSPVKSRIFVVVIDPGHGGKDPGATGIDGTREKDVVLAVAKQLAELINHQPNMRAVLTRDHDYFVPLRNRLKLARKGDADLFIALHADSYFNTRANGASIYALSERGATSEAARWLAKRDNYSELGDVDLKELNDQSYLLRSVLIDLAQTATINDSLRVGASMLKSMKPVTSLHYKRVEQAPFVVLKSPDIPSVLVEIGFISNAREELKLRDPRYQQKVANALFLGINRYVKKYSTLGV